MQASLVRILLPVQHIVIKRPKPFFLDFEFSSHI
ncbi:uncharacterized protein METZ01_LOCUS437874, partial [marine metagenome]